MKNHQNPIVRLTFNFALEIIKYFEELEKLRQYIISRQILSSGTSIGANIIESQSAESKKDFIHKLKIANKELLETEYWLMLCQYSEKYPDTNLLQEKLFEIKKVLNTIIATSIRNLKRNNN